MTIQYASDLHLEFRENKSFLKCHPILPCGDILLLAGDIVNLSAIDECNEFFDYLSANVNAIYWVLGNLEYHNSNINNRPFSINEAICRNYLFVKSINNFRYFRYLLLLDRNFRDVAELDY